MRWGSTDELTILSVNTFGHGYSFDAFYRGLRSNPDVIVGQGTSADTGPYIFGSNELYPHYSKAGEKQEIEVVIAAAKERNIPFIFSSGGSGTNPSVEGVMQIIDEIAAERKMELKIAVISGEIDKEYLKAKLKKGAKIKRLTETRRLPEYLTMEEVDRSARILAQMGPEPVMKALDLGVDGVLCGRSLDTGLYMAYPLKKGFDKGCVALMAKTVECGALAATPGYPDPILVILRKDHFLVRPCNPVMKCTVTSVAVHAFYERVNPTREEMPGGYLDIGDARFEQYDDTTVRVSGAKWIPAKYQVKLEGVRKIGYRTISVNGMRDPLLIRSLDVALQNVREGVRTSLAMIPEGDYQITFSVFGKNAVLGSADVEVEPEPREVCVIIDVVGKTQELSKSVCGTAEHRLLFTNYPGRLTTAGNAAWAFSPNLIEMGETYVWNIWHLMPLEDPCEPFKMQVTDFPRR